PTRKSIHPSEGSESTAAPLPSGPREETAVPAGAVAASASEAEPQEQHFTILYGDTGYSYESIVLPYLKGAKIVEIEDPYIRANHQIHNFVRFCEAVLKSPTVKAIKLTTSYDQDTDLKDVAERLDELKQSLLEMDIALEIKVNENLHDREIRIDNGWVIKIGRGLDFFQKPDSWFGVGSN